MTWKNLENRYFSRHKSFSFALKIAVFDFRVHFHVCNSKQTPRHERIKITFSCSLLFVTGVLSLIYENPSLFQCLNCESRLARIKLTIVFTIKNLLIGFTFKRFKVRGITEGRSLFLSEALPLENHII